MSCFYLFKNQRKKKQQQSEIHLLIDSQVAQMDRVGAGQSQELNAPFVSTVW